MRLRFPVCIYCRDDIDPSGEDFALTNKEEAKVGAKPRYAHQDCHNEVAGVSQKIEQDTGIETATVLKTYGC